MASGVSGDRCLLQRWCCIGSHYGMPRGCTLLCDDAHLFTRRTASHSSSSHSPLSSPRAGSGPCTLTSTRRRTRRWGRVVAGAGLGGRPWCLVE